MLYFWGSSLERLSSSSDKIAVLNDFIDVVIFMNQSAKEGKLPTDDFTTNPDEFIDAYIRSTGKEFPINVVFRKNGDHDYILEGYIGDFIFMTYEQCHGLYFYSERFNKIIYVCR